MRVEGLIFAGVASPDHEGVARFLADALGAELAERGIEPDGELGSGYGFRYRHFRAPDGRRFELLERTP